MVFKPVTVFLQGLGVSFKPSVWASLRVVLKESRDSFLDGCWYGLPHFSRSEINYNPFLGRNWVARGSQCASIG